MFHYFSRHSPERMGEAGSRLCWRLVDALIWSRFFIPALALSGLTLCSIRGYMGRSASVHKELIQAGFSSLFGQLLHQAIDLILG